MHTHLSDIRSLYCPLMFSSSQISIDERVSIEHLWDPARNQSCGQPIFISPPPDSIHLFIPSTSVIPPPPPPPPPPPLIAGAPSGSLLRFAFSLFPPSLFSLSCLCCLWQIGKLCFTNVGTCVKWGSIVCLTGCLY